MAENITLSNNASGSVAITGRDDVRRFLRRCTDGHPSAIHRVTATLVEPSGRVELARNGRAHLLDGPSTLVATLRDSLRQALDGQ
jgi:hypothetical protein